MRYCGVVPVGELLQLAMLEEVRASEPPVRLEAAFFEPGGAADVAAELRTLDELVLAVSAPAAGAGDRVCDALLRERGVAPEPPHAEASRLYEALPELGVFAPPSDASEGPVAEGSYRAAALVETNVDAVFCALGNLRVPAKRHPLGIDLRLAELDNNRVIDTGGELRHRRIEEIEAAAAALCAHRYAVAHASWLGRAEEGVVVLPGATPPGPFRREGVIPPVERLRLPRAPA